MFKSENDTLLREDQRNILEIMDSCNRFGKLILLECSLLYQTLYYCLADPGGTFIKG